jgi:hypothetical protein
VARLAAALLLALAIAGCGGSGASGGDDLSRQFRTNFVAGCVDSGQPDVGCECLYHELSTKQGIDTQTKFRALSTKLQAAMRAPNPAAAAPPEFVAAGQACRASLRAS